jgi:hypothetical protein
MSTRAEPLCHYETSSDLEHGIDHGKALSTTWAVDDLQYGRLLLEILSFLSIEKILESLLKVEYCKLMCSAGW